MITSYEALPEDERGIEVPFEFIDRLLPLIRSQAVRRVSEAMLRAMSDGKHGDVFTTGELLTLTGMDPRKLHPALKSEIFERVGHGRYRLDLRDWRPISRPARPKVTTFGQTRSGSLVSPVRSVGRNALPSVELPPSRACAGERAISPPTKLEPDLRKDNLPQGPQGECDPVQPGENLSSPQVTGAQSAGQPAQGSTNPAGSQANRLPFRRGWIKPGRTALDLLALHAAMTHQAADPRMTRYARFWMMRAGGYAKAAALIVWTVENWEAVQESLDLFDQQPTLEVVYNHRASIGRLMDAPEHPAADEAAQDDPSYETEEVNYDAQAEAYGLEY